MILTVAGVQWLQKCAKIAHSERQIFANFAMNKGHAACKLNFANDGMPLHAADSLSCNVSPASPR